MSKLLDRLRQHKDDRGLMAELRYALVESKKHRAWPALHRLGVDLTHRVVAVVAGLYATHPKEGLGNFGDTCRAVQSCRGDSRGEDTIGPIERRFLHLLAADNEAELHQRVTRMVLMAKSLDVPVNYERLEKDLRFWNERTKIDWAARFWIPDVALAVEEGADT